MIELNKEEVSRLTREYAGDFGFNHTHRLLKLIEIIGEDQSYDADVIWMAAHLHDWGAYKPWSREGIDHAVRSGEVAGEYLLEEGYPEDWIEKVKVCIVTHHQADCQRPIEAILLSDADVLDFLGALGILREFSRKSRVMREAYETSIKRMQNLPDHLCLEKSRAIASQRIAEMESFYQLFRAESFGFY
jgi:uncharacterized protein